MARKPHNYEHFQNLVSELKEQNAGNTASLQKHLEIQTDVLQSMKGFMLKGLQSEADTLRKERENELEGKKEKSKGLTMKSKQDLPKFSGKGFMGMLGNFLSTALIGIPGGLRRFLPAALGMSLIPKLARGVALMVAGPALIKALEAGFSQKTFSGGISAFMDSYFSSHGEAYTSLGAAAAGGAGKGALLGFGLLGPRGAIIGGILGGALTGLNHIFTDGSGKMNSKGTVEKVKAYMLDNAGMFAGVTGALMGAKWGIAGGPAGIIAGAMIGGGLGYMGAGVWKEMMSVEKGGEKDLGVAFRTGLKNWYMKIDWGSGGGAAGAGAIFGAAMGAPMGPVGMLAGALLGAAAGLVGGPILSEALKINDQEGKGMADAMKTATWNFIKRQAKNPYVTSALAGAAAGGILGGVGSLPGIIAGAIIGAIFGVIVQWLTNTIGAFAGEKFAKVFGIEKVLSPAEKALEEARADASFQSKQLATQKKGTWKTGSARQNIGKRGKADPYEQMQTLYSGYLQTLAEGRAQGMYQEKGVFHPSAASHVARTTDVLKKDSAEFDAIKLKFLQNKLKEDTNSGAGNQSSTNMYHTDYSSVNSSTTVQQNHDFVNMDGSGLLDGDVSHSAGGF
jgi:hypothetical protein